MYHVSCFRCLFLAYSCRINGRLQEEEWPDLLKYLKRQLPLTFRINGSGRFAENLVKKLSDDSFLSKFTSEELVVEGEVVSPPKPLAWYPNKLAWQLDFSRSHLRKIPEMKEMHEFIKLETETGSITRQEAVSMIPPLFLDCQPGHRILDMCAAPGSKTFQMLEALHNTSDAPGSSLGLVVGNDADIRRCATLTHQALRMRSPSLVVTNHEAQNFPWIIDSDPTSDDAGYMWDRILCDVPCSGDGTLRKSPGIWSKWSQGDGNGLHMLQLKIAMRAAELLKVGGRMVYSTCTFNPIEDEAVVAELLRRTHGGLRLVETSEVAKGLKFQPGLSTWKVMDSAGNWHESWETGQSNPKLHKSMFPDDDVESLGLSKTMRFLPHHQNTGGFYVAVLEKIKEMPALVYPSVNKSSARGRRLKNVGPQVAANLDVLDTGKVVVKITVDNDPSRMGSESAPPPQAGGQPDKAARKKQAVKKEDKVLPEWGPRGVADGTSDPKWKGTDPILPYKNTEILERISDFYGIAVDSPLISNLVARTSDPLPRKLVYLGDGPKLLLQMDEKNKLKVVAAGVKVFERQDSKVAQTGESCRYRISQEGTHLVLPHMTKQVVALSVDDFSKLLSDRVVYHSLSNADAATEVEETEKPSEAQPKAPKVMFESPKTQEAISKIGPGCCVVLIAGEDLRNLSLINQGNDSGISGSLRSEQPFTLPCWKGKSNLSVMVSKIDCQQMLDRIQSAKKT